MKIRFYLALAAAALVMTNCSQDEELVQVKQPTKGFTATIEGASRSNATETGAFSWTFGDAISVWNGSTFDKYANSEGNESTFTFTPNTDEEAGIPTDYAIYPAGMHSISGQTVTIDLPATYAHGSTNAPMLATITDGSTTLAFKHLGGLMRFVVKNVPEGASSFVFTTTNNILTGTYNVIDEQIYQNEGVVNNINNNVTITFTELTAEAESMVFFVPLPVGTYGEYTVEIKGDNLQNQYTNTSTGVSNTIGRCTMLLMPEFTCTDQGLEKASVAEIPVTGEDVNLSGIQNVTIGTDNATANNVLNINYTPSEGNAALNIKDDSNATESQENSKGKIVINPQGSEAIESLNLNTPSLTAELGAGTYGTVEALTAQQTLIIGEGVTIKKLVLKGGNVELKGKVENIECEVATTITLESNITLVNAMTFSRGDATINLNGYDITAPNTDVFIVEGTLTIKDDNNEGIVTAGSSNPANGVCAVWAKGGTVTINGGYYIVHADQAEKRNDCIYAGHNADNANTAGNITINGGKFEYVWPDNKNYAIAYNGDQFLLNCANSDNSTTRITVNGGSFKNHVPSLEDTGREGEVELGEGKAVYNNEILQATAHSKEAGDTWYEVKDSQGNED